MDDIELAWLAGLLEGEGSFALRPAGKGVNSPRNLPWTKVAMTDLDVIHKAHRVAGFGRVSTAKPDAKGCIMHIWESADRELVPDLLRRLLPHMGNRRGERIREVLAGAAPYGWDGTKRSQRYGPRPDRVVVFG